MDNGFHWQKCITVSLWCVLMGFTLLYFSRVAEKHSVEVKVQKKIYRCQGNFSKRLYLDQLTTNQKLEELFPDVSVLKLHFIAKQQSSNVLFHPSLLPDYFCCWCQIHSAILCCLKSTPSGSHPTSGLKSNEDIRFVAVPLLSTSCWLQKTANPHLPSQLYVRLLCHLRKELWLLVLAWVTYSMWFFCFLPSKHSLNSHFFQPLPRP